MTEAAARYRVVRASSEPHLARDLPPPAFLSPGEESIFAGLAFPLRRRKWLLGRFAAKGLLLEALGAGAPRPSRVSILNADSGAPYAELDGARVPYTLSISHREDLAAAAVIPGEVGLGLDLELVVERDPGLVRDFFTDLEQARIAAMDDHARRLEVARVWSAKEAVLKALGVGLRLDTRRIEVLGDGAEAPAPGWSPLWVTARTEAGIIAPRVGWRNEGDFVLTLARLG